MSVVIDASIAIAWLMPDERTEASIKVLRLLSSTEGLVPTIFRHEIRNILLVSERRQRITRTEVDESLRGLDEPSLRDCGPGDDAEVVSLARVHRLTAYDAAYLALALSTGSPLATLDRALAAAARACNIAILGPLSP